MKETPPIIVTKLIAVVSALASASSMCLAAAPGTPADSGFAAVSSTFYVNTNSPNLSSGNTEHLGVDIAANGNILLGWEDDGDGITDFEGVWTLFGPTGNLLISPTVQTNRSLLGAVSTYDAVTNTYLSYFRSDNTPIGGYTGWGPYGVKANRFGNGMGFAALCWEIGWEIDELFALNEANGGNGNDDQPLVQLLNNDGTPLRQGPIVGITNLGIVGFSEADVTPAGNIWNGDFGYLASGNIVIAGESRQEPDDYALTGQTGGHIPIYRIVTPGGLEVHARAAISSEAIGGSMTRGVAVTANGFAMRWDQDPGNNAQIRLFDNAGNPTTANISLATLSGHPEVGQGGDSEGCGFQGNGADAYVNVNTGGGTPWVTVINADGTLRWSRKVQDDSDPIDTSKVNDTDGAIDASGRVIVVFSSWVTNNTDPAYVASLIQARMFDRNGSPLGPRFTVSETESAAADPTNIYTITSPATDNPRVAWRGNNVVVVWRSMTDPDPAVGLGTPVIAARILAAPITITSASRSGTTTTINWTGGKAPYTLWRKSPVTGSWGSVQTSISGNSTTDTFAGGEAYYRVQCSN